MNYYKRNIGRLWQGKASLKDYEVEKAIKQGGAILTLLENNEKMFLNVEQLKSALMTKTKKLFHQDLKENNHLECAMFSGNKKPTQIKWSY